MRALTQCHDWLTLALRRACGLRGALATVLLAIVVVVGGSELHAQTANKDTKSDGVGNATGEVMLTRSQILEDLELARALLERHHPNFGLHSSTEEINATFDAITRGLPETATIRETLRHLLPAVAAVRDGHTCLTFAPEQLGDQMQRMKAAPLDLVALEGKIYVEKRRSGAWAGSEVTAINDKPIERWIAEANEYFCLDKTSDLTAFDPLADTLPFYFWLVDPDPKRFVYDLILPNGNKKRTRFSPASPLKQYQAASQRARKRFDFQIYSGAAVLTVNTFLGQKNEFESFFDRVFNEMNERNVRDLVIDLRENTGGQIGNASLLLAYLLDRSHHFPRYIHVTGKKISRNAPVFLPAHSQNQLDRIRKDGNRLQLRYRNYPTRYEISPRGTAVETQSVTWGKRHFKGQLHVLISGKTYSAASLFVGELRKNRPSAVFYGQRTGGLDNRGCMRNPIDFALPNSGLLLSVPVMCHIQDLDAEARHFLPDVEDELTAKDFFDQRDTVLDDVVGMIRLNVAPGTRSESASLPPVPLPKPAPFLAVKP